MITLLTAAIAALGSQVAPATPLALNVDIPQVEGLIADPTCGGRAALVSQAFCMATTQAAIEGTVTRMSEAFAQQGWLAADGRENLIVFIKRKPEGGCDSFQMVAFADEARVSAPAAPAYLALAAIPVDICKPSATTVPPAQ